MKKIPTNNFSENEGYENKALGNNTHTEGENNIALGKNSHVEGEGNVALGKNQHVSGMYNKENEETLVIVGNGTKEQTNNAYVLDKEGNATFSGIVKVNNDEQLATLTDVENLIPINKIQQNGTDLEITDKTINIEADKNQNAFSSITLKSNVSTLWTDVTMGGDENIVRADEISDNINLVAGNNVSISKDTTTNDTITIEAVDTTYENATSTEPGLMSTEDYNKLHNIDSIPKDGSDNFVTSNGVYDAITTEKNQRTTADSNLLNRLTKELMYQTYTSDEIDENTKFYLDIANMNNGVNISKAITRNSSINWQDLVSGNSVNVSTSIMQSNGIISNGTVKSITLSDDLYLGLNEGNSFTIAFSIKLPYTTNSLDIFSINSNYTVAINKKGSQGIRLITYDTNKNQCIYPPVELDETTGYSYYMVPNYYDDYIHYAVVFDVENSLVKWYQNGNLIKNSEMTNIDGMCYIPNGGTVNFLNSTTDVIGMQYLKVLNRALTQSEVQKIYNDHSSINYSSDVISYDNKLRELENNSGSYSNVGTSTKPIYFDEDGNAKECTYELNKTVPSNAVFTDTKVVQSLTHSSHEHPLLFSTETDPNSGTAYETCYDTGITVNPYTNTINATTFNGNATNATNDELGRPIIDYVYKIRKYNNGYISIYTGKNDDEENSSYDIKVYELPTASSSTLGGVKTTSTVTSTIGYTACPIISGVPYYKNTTYSAATTSTAGLMSADDKTKLDAITASADSVSFTPNLTSGTLIGTLMINGVGTQLYSSTNSHYVSKNVVGSSTATSNTTSALTNGNVYINSVENESITSSHKISGSGATTVKTDTSGNIIINSTDTNTKVAQNYSTANSNYPILFSTQTNPSDGVSYETYIDTGITVNPSTNTINATTFNGNATSATILKNTNYIDGMPFDGSKDITHYGICYDAGQTKTVVKENFNLNVGSTIKIKFKFDNTADSPTLNVNSTGDKPIVYRDKTINSNHIKAGDIYEFLYNGANWELIGDINTYSISASANDIFLTNEITGMESTVQLVAGNNINISTSDNKITFNNSGVRSISSGSSNGTISVNTNGTTSNVSVKGLGTAAYKSISDSTAASYFNNNVTSLVTERDVYYGTPFINDVKTYTSDTNIYAPNSAGTSGYVLFSNGAGAPSWGKISTNGTINTRDATIVYGLEGTHTIGVDCDAYWTTLENCITNINNNFSNYTSIKVKLLEGIYECYPSSYYVTTIYRSSSLHITFEGNGYNTILGNGTSEHDSDINISNNDITFKNLTLYKIQIECTSCSSTAYVDHCQIKFKYTPFINFEYLYISHCSIQNLNSFGSFVENGAYVNINNCDISYLVDSTESEDCTNMFDGIGTLNFNNNKVTLQGSSNNGCIFDTIARVICNGNYFNNAGTILPIYCNRNSMVSNINITGNIFESFTTFCENTSKNTSGRINAIINNNTFMMSNKIGINTYIYADSLTFNGNYMGYSTLNINEPTNKLYIYNHCTSAVVNTNYNMRTLVMTGNTLPTIASISAENKSIIISNNALHNGTIDAITYTTSNYTSNITGNITIYY